MKPSGKNPNPILCPPGSSLSADEIAVQIMEHRYKYDGCRKPMSPSLTQQDYYSLASLRYALRKFLRFSKDLASVRAKLTPEQYEALLALKAFSGDNGLTVGQLSERVQVKHHTAVSLTDKLAARRLLTKHRGGPDRRYVYVKLTTAGTKAVAALAAAHRRELRKHAAEMIKSLNDLKK
jgi:DNA-binding MarR family transcriptional regulator